MTAKEKRLEESLSTNCSIFRSWGKREPNGSRGCNKWSANSGRWSSYKNDCLVSHSWPENLCILFKVKHGIICYSDSDKYILFFKNSLFFSRRFLTCLMSLGDLYLINSENCYVSVSIFTLKEIIAYKTIFYVNGDDSGHNANK